MGKKKKQLTQQKEKWFGFTSSYASNILTDTDADNSFEIDNYVYSDSQVVECLDYMVNMTLTNIEFEKEHF